MNDPASAQEMEQPFKNQKVSDASPQTPEASLAKLASLTSLSCLRRRRPLRSQPPPPPPLPVAQASVAISKLRSRAQLGHSKSVSKLRPGNMPIMHVPCQLAHEIDPEEESSLCEEGRIYEYTSAANPPMKNSKFRRQRPRRHIVGGVYGCTTWNVRGCPLCDRRSAPTRTLTHAHAHTRAQIPTSPCHVPPGGATPVGPDTRDPV